MRLYGYRPSMNAYKVRLLLSQLRLAYEWVEVSIFEGASHTEEFLKMNPAGAVPVLEPEPGEYISESNAILCYLAEGTSFFSSERWAKAKTLQWLFFEQDYVQPSLATLRHWRLTGKISRRAPEDVANREKSTFGMLQALSRGLGAKDFLVGNYSIADIALFAYVHRAAEAGFDLADFPAIQRWAERVKRTKDFTDEIYLYDIDPHSSAELR